MWLHPWNLKEFCQRQAPTMGHVTTFPKLPDEILKRKKKNCLPKTAKIPKRLHGFNVLVQEMSISVTMPYCSSVCCMYAVKEAIIAKEHAGGDLDCSIFLYGYAYAR